MLMGFLTVALARKIIYEKTNRNWRWLIAFCPFKRIIALL